MGEPLKDRTTDDSHTFWLCPCGAYLCRPKDGHYTSGLAHDDPCQFCERELTNQVTREEMDKAMWWMIDSIMGLE